MQVVSGPQERRQVHFKAPPAKQVEVEMRDFLSWFEIDQRDDPIIKAGLAHLWFVTIHPFDDGNGRIARAIGDMALARAERSSQRFYSLAAQIERERSTYYERLESAQKGTMDVTPWLGWFLSCIERAISGSEATLADVLRKARFWQRRPPAFEWRFGLGTDPGRQKGRRTAMLKKMPRDSYGSSEFPTGPSHKAMPITVPAASKAISTQRF